MPTPSSHRVTAALAMLAVAFALAACARGDAAAPPAGPVTLRLGYLPNLTHAPALVGIAEGTFERELGEAATLRPTAFTAGPAIIEALFAGEIDIAYVGPSPTLSGHVQSNGRALRVIAGSTSGGASLVVRPGAGITSPADFAGKRVATPQLGNTQDVALRTWLLEHGLAPAERGGNVTVVPVDPATALTLFRKGDIDAAWLPEPWATRLVLEAGGTRFLDERTIWPGGRFVTTNVIVRTAFLEAHPDLVERFLAGHVAAIETLQRDPARAKDDVNEAIRALTGAALPPEVLDGAWACLEFSVDPLASTLRADAEAAERLGFYRGKRPNLSNLYALEPLNRVLQRLGLPPVEE